MRFVDIFAGLGGFHLAAASLGGKCVFACEINETLRELYEANFGILPAKDIRNVDPGDVPPHDVLCAGFPCQSFSKAGYQEGLKDRSRGGLFFNIPEILRKRQPKLLVLENVSHFVRHDKGKTYEKVKHALENAGYSVDVREYSPHQFGIPQIRQRIYLVGKLGGLNGFRWPTPPKKPPKLLISRVLDKNPSDAKPLSSQVVDCLGVWQDFLKSFPDAAKLPSFPIWSMEFKATYPFTKYNSLHKVPMRQLRNFRGSFGKSLRTHFRRDLLPRVPSHARAATSAFPRWKQVFIRQNRQLYREHRSWIDGWLPKIQRFPPSLQKLEWNCQGEERDIWKYVIQFRASGVRVKRATTSPSLVAMTTSQVPIIAWERRYMTPRECSRLQSMECLKHLPRGVEAVTALGNAVNVEVVRRILERLLGS
jgi:DNA (cytosine-5)-methyltransferase 1